MVRIPMKSGRTFRRSFRPVDFFFEPFLSRSLSYKFRFHTLLLLLQVPCFIYKETLPIKLSHVIFCTGFVF